MIYGIGIVAGTLLGFAGLATLSRDDHPPATRVPTEAVGEAVGIVGPNDPVLRIGAGVPLYGSGSTTDRQRTLVRAADRVFGDRVATSGDTLSLHTDPESMQALASTVVALPIGKDVEVRLIARYSTDVISIGGKLVACDSEWLQIESGDNRVNVLIARSNVSYIREIVKSN
jgi:hypothetical protein